MNGPKTTSGFLRSIKPAICVYGGGLIIGLTLVSFPASSAILKAVHHFTDADYGGIYLPQLITAILGAVAGGAVEKSFGLKRMFLTSLVAFALAQALLATSAVLPNRAALLAIMLATGCFGFGFGFGGGPLNAFTVMLFPGRKNSAVTALHMFAGAGLTISPFFFALLSSHGHWIAGPTLLLIITISLLILALVSRFPDEDTHSLGETSGPHPSISVFFWICAGCSVLYSVAEGMFSNWAILFLHDERAFSDANAALALTLFWAALTLGRLGAAILSVRVPPLLFLVTLPLFMAIAFLLLPHVSGEVSGWTTFAFAGLSCSAFFPMLVGFSAAQFPTAISWIASMLTAAMMVGVGIGSYVIGALRGVQPIAGLYDWAVLAPMSALILVALALAVRSGASGRPRSISAA